MTIPEPEDYAQAAAIEICKRMGLEEIQVIGKKILHPAEGTYLELKGKVPFLLKKDELQLPKKEELLDDDELFNFFLVNIKSKLWQVPSEMTNIILE